MKISIALVTYNSSRFLKEQIETILLNMSNEDELIISDDESKDNTLDIIHGYMVNDKRIKLYQISHGGCNANYENAISHCTGDIIVLSDDDNVWHPNKLEVTKKYFNENPKLTMLMNDCEVVDEHLNQIEPSYIKYNHAKPGLWRNIIRCRYGGSLIAFRSSLCKYILPFPKNLPCFYDDWIGMMAEKHGKVIFIDDVLSKWRRYQGANSTQFVKTNGGEKPNKIRKLKKKITRFLSFVKLRTLKIILLFRR